MWTCGDRAWTEQPGWTRSRAHPTRRSVTAAGGRREAEDRDPDQRDHRHTEGRPEIGSAVADAAGRTARQDAVPYRRGHRSAAPRCFTRWASATDDRDDLGSTLVVRRGSTRGSPWRASPAQRASRADRGADHAAPHPRSGSLGARKASTSRRCGSSSSPARSSARRCALAQWRRSARWSTTSTAQPKSRTQPSPRPTTSPRSRAASGRAVPRSRGQDPRPRRPRDADRHDGSNLRRQQPQFEGYTGGGTKETVHGLMSSGDVGHFSGRTAVHRRSRRRDDRLRRRERVPRRGRGRARRAPRHPRRRGDRSARRRYGQRLRSFVVVRPGASLSEQDVKDYVKSRLARFKVPRDVVFVDELPRNPTGKVVKRMLNARERVPCSSRRRSSRPFGLHAIWGSARPAVAVIPVCRLPRGGPCTSDASHAAPRWPSRSSSAGRAWPRRQTARIRRSTAPTDSTFRRPAGPSTASSRPPTRPRHTPLRRRARTTVVSRTASC